MPSSSGWKKFWLLRDTGTWFPLLEPPNPDAGPFLNDRRDLFDRKPDYSERDEWYFHVQGLAVYRPGEVELFVPDGFSAKTPDEAINGWWMRVIEDRIKGAFLVDYDSNSAIEDPTVGMPGLTFYVFEDGYFEEISSEHIEGAAKKHAFDTETDSRQYGLGGWKSVLSVFHTPEIEECHYQNDTGEDVILHYDGADHFFPHGGRIIVMKKASANQMIEKEMDRLAAATGNSKESIREAIKNITDRNK